MTDEATLGGLFLSGLISSTLLPGGSEALFGWMLLDNPSALLSLFIAVTVGNALGGVITLLMGGALARRYPLQLPEKPVQQRAQRWLTRFGPAVLLLSWLPLVGDPLCFVAGWLRLNLLISMVMITLGKAARYGVLAALLMQG